MVNPEALPQTHQSAGRGQIMWPFLEGLVGGEGCVGQELISYALCYTMAALASVAWRAVRGGECKDRVLQSLLWKSGEWSGLNEVHCGRARHVRRVCMGLAAGVELKQDRNCRLVLDLRPEQHNKRWCH